MFAGIEPVRVLRSAEVRHCVRGEVLGRAEAAVLQRTEALHHHCLRAGVLYRVRPEVHHRVRHQGGLRAQAGVQHYPGAQGVSGARGEVPASTGAEVQHCARAGVPHGV